MIEAIKKYEQDGDVKIRLIKSKKFKTDLIIIFFLRPLTKEEASKMALVSRMIYRASNKYSTSTMVGEKLDELYGASFSTGVAKYGEKLVFNARMQFPNKRLIENKEIFIESVEFLKCALLDTYSKDGKSFDDDYFEQEKTKLKEEIKSRINDKMIHAIELCIGNMCENEPFSISPHGDLETIEKLTNEEVYKYYLDILNTSQITEIVIGDIDFDETYNIVKNIFINRKGKIINIPNGKNKIKVEKTKYLTKVMNVNQGRLTLGYRMNIDIGERLYEPAILFTTILGSGGNSALFRNIREKESLCYYIFSKVEKFKSIMIISSGIEDTDYDKTLKLILEEIEKMKKGDFEQKDIDVAKTEIVTSIKSLVDYQNSFVNFYYSRELSGDEYDEARIIEEVMQVTKEEIIEAGNMFVLDTVHFIKGEKKSDN